MIQPVIIHIVVQLSSCLTTPMNCSTPGLLSPHLPSLAQVHSLHADAIQPPLTPASPSAFNALPSTRDFSTESSARSNDQNIEAQHQSFQ